MLATRPLGRSGLEVSELALGSWRSFERISKDEGTAVLTAARTAGITFLDDARYNDETGTAPIPSGWSEVIFGELLRAAGWPRDEAVVANKLWWEFYPAQSAMAELDGSLGRLKFDHVDLLYSSTLTDAVSVPEAVEAIASIIAAGKAREWAVVNWTGEQLGQALDYASAHDLPAPCGAQLAYSLVRRDQVENPATAAALARDVGLVPSSVFAGGALTGKYAARSRAPGRLDGYLADPRTAVALRGGAALAELAVAAGVEPAALALAFVWRHPAAASILLGATSAGQVEANVTAFGQVSEVTGDLLDQAIAVTAAA
jgi:aryl-alcohol dehydrogenase-like predicted oxidoreductase